LYVYSSSMAVLNLKLPTVSEITHKTVLVRVDFNVPLVKAEDGQWQVRPDGAGRLEMARKTIEFLLKHEAKVVLMSHLGRPKCVELDKHEKSVSDADFSLQPVTEYLQKHFHWPVKLVAECVGELAVAAVAELKPGEIVLLENLRFYPAEKKNEAWFAKGLAELGEVYINEAFSNCHRDHASMTGIPQLRPAFAGFELKAEVSHLNQIVSEPKRPLVVVAGGAKIADKIGALTNLSRIADAVLVGGGIANNFLKADGIETHKSYFQNTPVDAKQADTNYVTVAGEIIAEHHTERILKDGYVPLPKIIYPIDVVAAKSPETDRTQIIDLTHDMADTANDKPLMYLDIGPKTIKLYTELILSAGTVFWNGPMGVYEQPPFAAGTKAIARAMAQSSALTIIGGGDTIAAAHHFKLNNQFDFVSAAGSAALEFLSGTILPGLAALNHQR
jgi:phosphoglycerate kinase